MAISATLLAVRPNILLSKHRRWPWRSHVQRPDLALFHGVANPRLSSPFALSRCSILERRWLCKSTEVSSSSCWDNPYQHSIIGGLAKHAMGFPVKGENVDVLATPQQFYETLKEGIRNAKDRVVMSSLYIGTGPLEMELLDVIADSLRTQPSLRALLLFDALRSTRPARSEGSCSTSDSPRFKSSADMLTDVLLSRTARWKQLEEMGYWQNRVKIALYRTPDLTKALEKILPARLNEVVGVCHMKVYIFDNNLLMSGANLSASYFTNRQDRYILLRDCQDLADYFCKVVETVASFSYLLNSEGVLQSNTAKVDPRSDPVGFRRELYEALERISFCPLDQDSARSSRSTCSQGGLCLDGCYADTWVFPTLQMGPLGICQDEMCFLWLLANLPAGSFVGFASAYFNLTREFEAALLQAATDKYFKILTAAPQANGFYGSRGLSGLIPKAYSLLEKNFYEQTREHISVDNVYLPFEGNILNAKSGIELFEYKKKDWTFHGKGLWIYLPNAGSLPSITLIGSSNFGFRSRQRDLEAQLFLITLEPTLRKRLQQENDLLFQHGERVHHTLFLDPDRLGGKVSLLAAQLVRSWL